MEVTAKNLKFLTVGGAGGQTAPGGSLTTLE
jgi:hypothetical protein